MESTPSILSAAVPCHRCGYDVRAQPPDGVCPECEASVAESRRVALIPIRPAWRDSDPRWRRRMVAGAWVLALVPLFAVLRQSGWTKQIPAPQFFDVQAGQTLDGAFVDRVYVHLVFSIGVVLLFARERGRQRERFDWTRRWGVVASYGVLLLGGLEVAFITALVVVGLAALFISMPPAFTPVSPYPFVTFGANYLLYGPHPDRLAAGSLAACSAMVVLLACAPLFDALRSSGPRVLAIALLVPLAVSSLAQLAYVGAYTLDLPSPVPLERYLHPFYFDAGRLAEGLAGLGRAVPDREALVELVKWLPVVAIALWLSVAQVAARVARRRTSAA